MIQIVSSGGAVTNAETEIAGVAAGAQRAWYVVETKRHRERQAQNHLAERHVPSYLPRIVQWPRPAVGSAIAPMFPGYLFVHAAFPDDFYRTVWTPGVKTFVSFGGFTSPLDACVVDFLRSQEGPDGIIHCGDRFKESSEVRIIRGPFQGLTAVVTERLPARERVRVLMDLLQRQTPVELPERWVAPI